MASGSLLQVGGHTHGERDGAGAKRNVTISGKMRLTPTRSLSLSPCDAHGRCTSRGCAARHPTGPGGGGGGGGCTFDVLYSLVFSEV